MAYGRSVPWGQSLCPRPSLRACGLRRWLRLPHSPCSCCPLGNTQLLEEVGETPQGTEWGEGQGVCHRPGALWRAAPSRGRGYREAVVKNKTRSPQPSARSSWWGLGGVGDAADTHVQEASRWFLMSQWQTCTPHLSPAQAGSGRMAGGSGRWWSCQGPLGNFLGDPRPVTGLCVAS